MRNRGYRFGRLIITWTVQPSGAAVVDEAFTRDAEGNRYVSRAILLRPWKRNRWGEPKLQRALVVGWRS